MMKKYICLTLFALALAACSSTSPTGETQMYGEIKGGVEHTHTH